MAAELKWRMGEQIGSKWWQTIIILGFRQKAMQYNWNPTGVLSQHTYDFRTLCEWNDFSFSIVCFKLQQVNSPSRASDTVERIEFSKFKTFPAVLTSFLSWVSFFPLHMRNGFKMGCSGLQTESQECETSERKCESFPVRDLSSVLPSLERKDNENCVWGER